MKDMTWTDVTGNLPFPVDHYKAIVFAGNFVYVATDKGVVMSANGTDWYILTGAKGKPLIIDYVCCGRDNGLRGSKAEKYIK